MHLVLETPWYFVPLCLLLGVAYAAALYLIPKRKRPEGGLPRGTTWLLAVLRCLAVTAIAFLLLSPLFKHRENSYEKPIVIIAADNSRSPLYSSDSSFCSDTLGTLLQRVATRLQGDYEVQCYAYGHKVQPLDAPNQLTYTDEYTNLSALLHNVAERYAQRNVAAVLLTGDGIYNQGHNPATQAQTFPYPIYTLPIGDTTQHSDAAVVHVKCNRMAYLHSRFPMEITLQAHRLQGTTRRLSVTENGHTLYSKTITYDNDNFTATETLLLDADVAGLHHYVVHIDTATAESNVRNNTIVVPVEVIDGRRRVAIVAAAPHPDVAALRHSMEQRQDYAVTACMAEEWKDKVEDYDLLVLHQLPAANGTGRALIQQSVRAGVPLLVVIGSATDVNAFNALNTGLTLRPRAGKSNEVTAAYHDDFTAFALSEDHRNRIEAFPPLLASFGEYKTTPNAQVLFTARLGTVKNAHPLLVLSQQQEHRCAVVAGEGLWRWRLADYRQNGSHEVFDDLVDRLVTYTSMKVNKDRFHVRTKTLWDSGEEVLLEVELYNDNYEQVNTPEVELKISRRADTAATQSYRFHREGSGYALNIGHLSPGTYNYTATTTYNGAQRRAQGSIVVQEVDVEARNLQADHTLMNTLSAVTGGRMLPRDSVEHLPELLHSRGAATQIIHSRMHYTQVVNMPWVFVLVLLLLSAEWVLRKYHGEV